jgi:hypothetical protein
MQWWVARAGLAGAFFTTPLVPSGAQDAKQTPQQIAAIRGCAEKNQDAIGEGERCACTIW